MVFRAPDWTPLERALVREYGESAGKAINAFWFVGFLSGPDDIGELRLYEHQSTKKRLILDFYGRAYREHTDLHHFSPIAVQDALVEVLL